MVVTWAHLPGSVTTMSHPYTKVDRLQAAITDLIESGEYPPGAKLPSQRELCDAHGVSLQVVRTALDRLKARGVVVGVPGSGYYVAGDVAPTSDDGRNPNG